MRRQRIGGLLLLWAVLAAVGGLLLACGGAGTHAGHGVVREVAVEEGQVLLAHDEIPGVMPAMTMNIAIYDAELLASLQVGDEIDFELTVDRGSLYITAAEVVGQAETGGGWVRLGEVLVPAEPAPGFALIDQAGRPFSLEEQRGRAVLLDFIFTRCPGPCPILTSTHVVVQRSLAPELLPRTRFVSISIDPERDTPQDLVAYATARGVDLGHWAFLTGPSDEIESVMQAYGVGSTLAPGGELEHVVASFLIDGDGRLVKRYLGLDHEPAEIVADLEGLASSEES
jgi:protein SCO1/2